MKKKILASILSLAMICTLMPSTMVSAEEADNTTNNQPTAAIKNVNTDISYLTSGDEKWTGEKVTFGKFGSGGEYNFSHSEDGKIDGFYQNYPCGTANEYDTAMTYRALSLDNNNLFLDSDKKIITLPWQFGGYKVDGQRIEWQNSSLRAWLNGTEFYENPMVFSNIEKSAIKKTHLLGSNEYKYYSDIFRSDYVAQDYESSDNVFLLSMDEVNRYYSKNDLNKIWEKYDYCNGESTKLYAWTRSLAYMVGDEGADRNGYVATYGYMNRSVGKGMLPHQITGTSGVSPAFNIDASKIFYTYEAGKNKPNNLEDVKDSNETTWTLTLKDGNNGFNASAPNAKILTGENLNINVSTLGTPGEGVDYTQLTGFVYNADKTEMLSYGKISDAKTGDVIVELPDSVKNTEGNYVLRVFAEDVNSSASNGLTDYSSNYVDIPFKVNVPHEWSYSVDKNVITATCNDTDCEYHDNSLKLTLTASDKSYSGEAYDGVSIENNITDITGATTGSIKYVGRDGTNYTESTTSPTNVGKYTASVTIGEKTATADFEITKANPEANITPATDLVYNGSEQALVTAGTTSGGTLKYLASDGTWTTDVPTAKDAGTYTVQYKVFGDDNYNTDTGKLTVVIDKKEVKVSSGITADGKNYDGNTNATVNCDNAVFDGIIGSDKLTVTANGTFDSKDVGDRTVTLDSLTLGGADLKNYKLADSGNQTTTIATIVPKSITSTITANDGVYGSTITGATAVLNGLVGDENPEITLTYTGKANDGTDYNSTDVPTLAGTYTVTATITDGNYSLAKSEAQFVVNRANPNLSISAVPDKNYGDNTFDLEVSHNGDGLKSFASDNEAVASVDENGVVTIVGAGKATLTVTLAESANYTADEKTVTITVKKIDHKLTVDKIAYEVTYGDPEFKITASAEDSETAINFVSDNEDAVKVSADGTVIIGNVGTAKITVSMDESSNYLAVAKDVTVTVVPKKVTVTPDKISKVYGDKDGELTYKADGLVGEDTLTDITLSRAEGENVGDYTITATQKEGANPNYEVTFNEGTFVIEAKDIAGAKVTLGDALKYTGKEQTQKIDKITVDGIEVPADSYEVTGNTATEAGVYTLTVTAKDGSNFTGTKTWIYVVAPTKTEQIKENEDGKIELGNGTVTIEVKADDNAPKTTLVTGKAEIIDMLVKSGDITADELTQIANGASVDIVLTVKDASATVSNEAKSAMTDTASKAGYTIGRYIDISLYKYMTVDGVTDDGVQLHSTADKIKIAVQIPENLINKDSKVNRTYYIIRYHDGKAEIIEGTYDEKTQTFTFETDKFSDYAIAYKDVKKADASGKNNAVKTTESVKTGDTANVFGCFIALVGAFAVILGLFISRRKRTNK